MSRLTQPGQQDGRLQPSRCQRRPTGTLQAHSGTSEISKNEQPIEARIESDSPNHHRDNRPWFVDRFGGLSQHERQERCRHRPRNQKQIAAADSDDLRRLSESAEKWRDGSECHSNEETDQESKRHAGPRRHPHPAIIPSTKCLRDPGRHSTNRSVSEIDREQNEVACQCGSRQRHGATVFAVPKHECVCQLKEHEPCLAQQHRGGKGHQRPNDRAICSSTAIAAPREGSARCRSGGKYHAHTSQTKPLTASHSHSIQSSPLYSMHSTPVQCDGHAIQSDVIH